jgi:hypothetical protein
MTTRRGLDRNRAVHPLCAMRRSGPDERRGQSSEPFIANKIQETWMKSVKTSAIACALSALLAAPALAQGVSSDTKARGGVQSKGLQGGAAASDDAELNATPGAADERMGIKSTKGTKATAGTTGSAARKGTGGDSTSGGAASGSRY